jgi:uncharacterized membrane protein YedE/YeeE
MKLLLAAFFSALLFGIGLGVSGMTLPTKVIGFLDLTGNWDPSLAFVMIGAIAVHGFSYRLIMRRSSPLLTTSFHVPKLRQIDAKLIIGSVLFGIGWGLGGFCPGPAIVAAISQHHAVLVFLLSMIGGIYLHKFANQRLLQKKGN